MSKKPDAVKKNPRHPIRYLTFYTAISGILLFVFLQISTRNISHTEATAAGSGRSINPAMQNTIRSLKAELKKNNKNPDILIKLGNIYFDIDNKSEAIVYYRNALNIESTNADVRIDLAICYHETGDSERAVKEIKKSLEYEPNHSKALLNLGIIHHSLGNTAQALHWWNKYLDTEPEGEFSDRIREYMKSIVE